MFFYFLDVAVAQTDLQWAPLHRLLVAGSHRSSDLLTEVFSLFYCVKLLFLLRIMMQIDLNASEAAS